MVDYSSTPPEGWLLCAPPQFGLRWRYPALTPHGAPVDVLAEQHGDVARVHLQSVGSAEVYFEVRRLPGAEPTGAYARHQADLAQRFAQDGFAITALVPAQIAGGPAHSYTFRWQQNERAVVLITDDRALYRIIYDPRSTLNAQILTTVQRA